MSNETQEPDWRELIYRGVEDQRLDYKAAQDWNALSRSSRAKFARHAMALANTKGGCVVVGVGEDSNGNPTLRTGLTEAQAKSFDPSLVGQTINRYADPSIDFDIFRPEVDGKRYAVLLVRRFADIPHVCCSSCDSQLQRGAFYIRTHDACSRVAYRASEVQELVHNALRNQRQVLGRLLRGVLYEGRQLEMTDDTGEFVSSIDRVSREAHDLLRMENEVPTLELTCRPTDFNPKRFTLDSIQRAISRVVLPPTEEMIFFDKPQEVSCTNASQCSHTIVAEKTKRIYWEIFRNGLLYYCTELPLKKGLSYRKFTRDMVVLLSILSQIYAELEAEDELLVVEIRLRNVAGLMLTGRPDGQYRCSPNLFDVEIRRTAADLVSDPVPAAVVLIRNICEKFGLTHNNHTPLTTRLHRFLNGHPEASK